MTSKYVYMMLTMTRCAPEQISASPFVCGFARSTRGVSGAFAAVGSGPFLPLNFPLLVRDGRGALVCVVFF